MEFLVEIEVHFPPDGDPAKKAELIAAEKLRARELADAGILRRVWRQPGRWANYGLWEAPNASALHEAIASLPLFPWLRVTVHPLAEHPSDPAIQARAGKSS